MTLKDGAGYGGLGTTGTTGVYTLAANSAANVTNELKALVFTPSSNSSAISDIFLTDTTSAGTSASGGALSLSGANKQVTLGGTTTVAIADLGSALRINVGSNTQTDTLTGFGSTDTTGVIDFKNGAGGYASTSAIVSALHSDGNGGTILTLGSTGSIDFANVAPSQLHASNFAIG